MRNKYDVNYGGEDCGLAKGLDEMPAPACDGGGGYDHGGG